jgi:hypothetical protein
VADLSLNEDNGKEVGSAYWESALSVSHFSTAPVAVWIERITCTE